MHSHTVTALAQSQEQLKNKRDAALHEKECLEETEILQGKISVLEDQLAKLEECSAQENREVIRDILKLEELKQEVPSLTAKRAKVQAMVLWLKEEKQLQEAALQSECGHFEEEKWQMGSPISSLQSSLCKSHWAQERLEQDLQTQDPKGQPGQLVALNAQHEQTGKGRQQLQEASTSLCRYIWIAAVG